MNDILINCPHCNQYIIISEVNCGIFRHGTYKSNFQQIESHLSKNLCENLNEKNLIYGCGKPFKLEKYNENYYAIVCDYL